jgi:hypothetical protein
MSFSFHLNNIPNLTLSPLVTQPGLSDLRFLEGYPAAQADHWPQGFTYIYQDQVTARSVEVQYDGARFEVRIFTASAPEDYALAVKLVAAVAKAAHAAIVPEGAQPLSLVEFNREYDASWIMGHCHHGLNAVFDVFADSLEKGHQISGVTGLMTIGPKIFTQMNAVGDEVAKTFFYRLKKLNYINQQDIYQSDLVVVKDDTSNTHLRLAAYGEGVETLLCDKNTVVGLSTGESSMIKVALTDMPGLLGDKALWLSEEILLLPALQGDQWEALIEAALFVTIEDLAPYSYDPQNDPFEDKTPPVKVNTGSLTPEQKDKLAYAPMVVFCLVAGADQKIDAKEINTFQRELVTSLTTDSATLQPILIDAISEFKPRISHLLNDGVDIQNLLVEIVELLDGSLSVKEAMSFKLSLLRMATKVAEASGGVLGVFGDKICKAEKQVLADMAKLFDLM